MLIWVKRSDLGLHCLSMSYKRDARLIWVKLSDLGLHCLPMS